MTSNVGLSLLALALLWLLHMEDSGEPWLLTGIFLAGGLLPLFVAWNRLLPRWWDDLVFAAAGVDTPAFHSAQLQKLQDALNNMTGQENDQRSQVMNAKSKLEHVEETLSHYISAVTSAQNLSQFAGVQSIESLSEKLLAVQKALNGASNPKRRSNTQ